MLFVWFFFIALRTMLVMAPLPGLVVCFWYLIIDFFIALRTMLVMALLQGLVVTLWYLIAGCFHSTAYYAGDGALFRLWLRIHP
jgi:hypothetical protein